MDTTVQHKSSIVSIGEYTMDQLTQYLKDLIVDNTDYELFKDTMTDRSKRSIFISPVPGLVTNSIMDLPITQILINQLGINVQENFVGTQPVLGPGYDGQTYLVAVNLNLNILATSYQETDRLSTLIYLALLHNGTQHDSILPFVNIMPLSISAPMPLDSGDTPMMMTSIAVRAVLDVTTYLQKVETAIASGVNFSTITDKSYGNKTLYW